MPEQVESKSGLPPKQRGHTVRIVDVAEVPIDFGLIENTLDGLKAHSNWDRKHNGAGLLAIEVSPEGCLLYTSPSPRDQRGSRMPSSA